jgi:hypothetical protein
MNIGIFLCTFSTMSYLPPLRFHCVGGCWDRIEPSAGIIEQSIGARNRVGIGLLCRPDRLHRLADRFLEIDCWAP